MNFRPELVKPIETCPKLPDVPYVIVVDGQPCVAQWDETSYSEPTWDLWLGGSYYGLAIFPEYNVTGWLDIYENNA